MYVYINVNISIFVYFNYLGVYETTATSSWFWFVQRFVMSEPDG